MTRVLLAAGLLLLATSAGCIGGQESPDRAPSPDPSDDPGDGGQHDEGAGTGTGLSAGNTTTEVERRPPAPFLLQGQACRDAQLRVPVDAEQARALIPDGFTLVPYQGQATGAGPIEQAALQVLTVRCNTGGLTRGASGWSLHLLALEVEPPEGLQASQALEELFLLEGLSDEQPVAQAFAQRGWNVSQGTVNLSLTTSPAGGAVFESQATGGNLSARTQGSTTGQNETRSSGFVRYWHAPADRMEYLHLALISSHEQTNATGAVSSQAPESLTGQLVGPGAAGQGALVGPYDLLATPTVVRAGP